MLEIENLKFSYGNHPVLRAFSLSVPEHGVHVLMGPSGCGKSTLLSLIAGLIRPVGGSLVCHAKKISYSFQEPRLLPWMNTADNVNFVLGGKGETLPKAEEALSELGLGNSLKKFPSELSGGMKKRVSLARAFAYDGDFLLLDEPTNGLDSETKEKIILKIAEIGKNTPVLMITHNEDDAKKCADNIFLFDECEKQGG